MPQYLNAEKRSMSFLCTLSHIKYITAMLTASAITSAKDIFFINFISKLEAIAQISPQARPTSETPKASENSCSAALHMTAKVMTMAQKTRKSVIRARRRQIPPDGANFPTKRKTPLAHPIKSPAIRGVKLPLLPKNNITSLPVANPAPTTAPIKRQETLTAFSIRNSICVKAYGI